jgi:ATP/maltotriose-dependent transcriptional regulator MalT
MVEAWRSAGRDAGGRQLYPVLMTPYFAGCLAEALIVTGDLDQAQALLDRLLGAGAGSREPFWDAELLRLRGMLGEQRHASREAVQADLDAARRLAAHQGAVALAARLDDPVVTPSAKTTERAT